MKAWFLLSSPIPEVGGVKYNAQWYEMLYKNVIIKGQAWMESSALFFTLFSEFQRRAFRAEQFSYMCLTKIVSNNRKKQT